METSYLRLYGRAPLLSPPLSVRTSSVVSTVVKEHEQQGEGRAPQRHDRWQRDANMPIQQRFLRNRYDTENRKISELWARNHSQHDLNFSKKIETVIVPRGGSCATSMEDERRMSGALYTTCGNGPTFVHDGKNGPTKPTIRTSCTRGAEKIRADAHDGGRGAEKMRADTHDGGRRRGAEKMRAEVFTQPEKTSLRVA